MKVAKFFDTYDLTKRGMVAFIRDWGGEIRASPNFKERGGASPVFSGSRLDSRTFELVLDLTQISNTFRHLILQEALGILFDERSLDVEHRLVVTMDDGSMAYRDVSVTGRPAISETYISITMQAARPGWYATKVESDTQGFTASGTIAIDNDGKISVYPEYRIGYDTQRTGSSGDIGYRYEQIWRIDNQETSTMRNECLRFDLNDTRAMVSGGKARSDGNDVRIWLYGKELDRDLVNWNTRSTFMWVTVPEVIAGGFVDLSMVYGNPTADTAPRLKPGSTQPAFSIMGDKSQTHPISGSNPTSGEPNRMNTQTSNWTDGQWVSGTVEVWDSAGGNNQSRTITQSGVNYIRVTPDWTTPPNGAWSYTIQMSQNTKHVYPVHRTDRTDWNNDGNKYHQRGGWYLNNGRQRPGRILFADQVPGAWSRVLTQKNEDRFSQVRYSSLDDGTGDKDSFAIFDATRTVGTGRKSPEDGQYDGVMLTSVHGFSAITFSRVFYNPRRTSSLPNDGIAKYKVLAQGAEGLDDWDTVYETGATDEAATEKSTQTYTYVDEIGYNPTHIAFAIWGRDIDNNDAEVTKTVRRTKVAHAQWGSILRVFIDNTKWTITKPQSETAKYDLNTVLRLNGGANAQPPYDRLNIGGAGHRIMIGLDENLYYDTKTGAVEIRSAIDDSTIRSVPYAATAYKYTRSVSGAIKKRIARGAMTFNVPLDILPNPLFAANIAGWSVLYLRTGAGGVLEWSNAPGTGALRLNITTSGGTLNGDWRMIAYNAATPFAVIPGVRYNVRAKVRTTSLNYAPRIGIAFAPDLVTTPSTPGRTDPFVPTSINTWITRQVSILAPSTARYGYLTVGAIPLVDNLASAMVYFDEILLRDAIHVSESAMGEVSVNIQYEEGWID
jgi:hypothetical protein